MPSTKYQQGRPSWEKYTVTFKANINTHKNIQQHTEGAIHLLFFVSTVVNARQPNFHFFNPKFSICPQALVSSHYKGWNQIWHGRWASWEALLANARSTARTNINNDKRLRLSQMVSANTNSKYQQQGPSAALREDWQARWCFRWCGPACPCRCPLMTAWCRKGFLHPVQGRSRSQTAAPHQKKTSVLLADHQYIVLPHTNVPHGQDSSLG